MPSQQKSLGSAERLIAQFESVFRKAPAWAVQFNPSIPFIGKKYQHGGLMIYASAENLAWLSDASIPDRFKTIKSWNRYRIHYDTEGRGSPHFFPDVGIAPVNNGGLLTAGLWISNRNNLPVAALPRDFLENLCITNFAKFSIAGKTNVDYIGNAKKLDASLSFVELELAELRPSVVILPHRCWCHNSLQTRLLKISSTTQFVPMPQFNATVVNTGLKFYEARGAQMCQDADKMVLEWMRHLRNISIKNAWRYLAKLQEHFDAQLP
jgi:hypothetical protein